MAEKEKTRVEKLRIARRVRVYVVRNGVVFERWGALLESGKLYLLKKQLFGWRIDKSRHFLVKPEHMFLEEERRGKKYLTLAVFVDEARGVSLPPPGSDAKPWEPEEIELGVRVVSNVWIMRMFEEERRKIMALMGRLQLIMVVMFVAVLAFAGILYWYSSGQLADRLAEVVEKVFPAPLPPGGG